MGDSERLMRLILTGTQPQLTGFRYFWMKYVNGFNPAIHCGPCLKGPYSKLMSNSFPTNQEITLNEAKAWDYVYICGVSPKWPTNFHLALKPGAGAVTMDTYNGFTVTVTNAEQVEIPALPDGWNGLAKEFTTCRNYQFGVEYYLNQATNPSDL